MLVLLKQNFKENENMDAFKQHTGLVGPVDRVNVDTDAIIPKQFLKRIERSGFGQFLFFEWRWDEAGNVIENFPLNQDRYQGASVLLSRANFGCGSSREHAPQALSRWGINAVVGESFAEIFAGNCDAMGIPAVIVSADVIELLMTEVESHPDMEMKLDIRSGKLSFNGRDHAVKISDTSSSALLSGTWDSTASLLASKDDIMKKAEPQA